MNAVLQAMVTTLDDVPYVMFCAKDGHGKYLAANQAFADRAGVSAPEQVVGRIAADLFPSDLAASYAAQDDELWRSRRPLRNQLELIRRPDGSLGWYVTSKVLVGDGTGGEFLASISVDLRAAGDTPAHAAAAAAVRHVRQHCTEPLRVPEVAAVAAVSVVQLERAVKRATGMSVRQLVARFRVELAISLLETTDVGLAAIAEQCGYYDQAAFGRQFRQLVGVTPGAYRTSVHRR